MRIHPTFAAILLTALSMLSAQFTLAQKLLSGRILNEATRQPLPFASVYCNDLKTGTLSDIDGRFQIYLRRESSALEISSVGFSKTTIRIDTLKSTWLDIRLRENATTLKEVVIHGEDSLALKVIQRAIRNKPLHDPSRLASYRYNSYNKVYSTLNRFDLDSVKSEKDTLALSRFLEKSHLFLSESVTERRYQSPGYEKEVVLANKFSGFKDPMFAFLSSSFQPFSFYSNAIKILNIDFIGPLSDNSWKHYDFAIENEIYTSSGDTIFTVSYWPQRKNATNCFVGSLTITSDQYALLSVNAGSTDPNAMCDLTLSQKYTTHERISFPEQLNTTVKFNKVHFHGANLLFVYKGYLKNIEVNPVLTNNLFDDTNLEFHPEATKRSETYWDEIRSDLSDEKDKRTYQFYDTLPAKSLAILNAYQTVNQVLALRYVPLKYFNIHLDRLLIYNRYEKSRPGLGFSTSPALSRYLHIQTYVGYGVQDRALKYHGALSLTLHKRSSSRITFSFAQDLSEGASPLINDNIVTGSRFGLREWLALRMDSVTRFRVELSLQALPNFWMAINLTRQVINPTYEYSFFDGSEPQTIYDVTGPELKLLYARGLNKIQVGKGSMYLKPKSPVFELKISKAIGGLVGSEYEFTRAQFSFIHAWLIRGLGKLNLSMTSGAVFGDAPYPFLFNIQGAASNLSMSDFYYANCFQLAGINEFLSDRYVSVFASQSLGALWNKKRSKPEVSIIHAMSYGQLSKPEVHSSITFKTFDRPYFESGLLVNNIVRFNYLNVLYWGIGGGVFYRYGNSLPDRADNIGAKASFTFSF